MCIYSNENKNILLKNSSNSIQIEFPKEHYNEKLDGRLIVLISKSIESEPRFQLRDDAKTCQGFGIKKKDEVLKQLSLELKKYIVPLKHKNAKILTSNAFVIEKSKPNIFMVINDKI